MSLPIVANFNRITTVTAGWSSLVARRAHNPKVVGSNPAPATEYKAKNKEPLLGFFVYYRSKSLFGVGLVGLSVNEKD